MALKGRKKINERLYAHNYDQCDRVEKVEEEERRGQERRREERRGEERRGEEERKGKERKGKERKGLQGNGERKMSNIKRRTRKKKRWLIKVKGVEGDGRKGGGDIRGWKNNSNSM